MLLRKEQLAPRMVAVICPTAFILSCCHEVERGFQSNHNTDGEHFTNFGQL
jgi:hypothetical protein